MFLSCTNSVYTTFVTRKCGRVASPRHISIDPRSTVRDSATPKLKVTAKLKVTSPLFKKCVLNTLTFHLNLVRPTFLFKKAPTKKP